MTVAEALDLALVHHRAKRLREAEQIYRQILAAHPDHAHATHLLALIAAQVGRHADARQLGERAVALRSDVPRYWHQLGDARRASGDVAGAEAAFRRAIELDPKYAEAHNQLGDLLFARGRVEDAVEHLRRAAEARPDLPQPHLNLGMALIALARHAEAVTCLRRAIELKPDLPAALANLGIALMGLGQIDAAADALQRSVAQHPDAVALNSLGLLRMTQGRIDDAIATFRHAVQLQPASAHIHSNLLLAMNYSDRFTPAQLLAEHRGWAERHERPLLAAHRPHGNDRTPGRRLRVGYVSPDFRQHPVGFFMRPLIEGHDRDQFEVFCYSLAAKSDEMTALIRHAADAWRSLEGVSDEQASEIIRGDAIDILVDLAGHTARNRICIFARKPAPLQIAYLGYVNTTGLKSMDYVLADERLMPSPESVAPCVSERVIRLPRSYLCYDPPVRDMAVGPLPAESAGFVTFASLNRLAKTTPLVHETWIEILRRVAGSRLILHADPGQHTDALRRHWNDAGLDPQRLELLDRIALRDYFALHQRVDIALDPFPHNGGTTTCDALWMGVPVVTFPGQTPVSRAGASLLFSANLPEMIAPSRQAYIELAVSLANDRPRLAELRRTLRPRLQASPLMDLPGFVRDVEAACRAAWVEWCQP